MERHVVELCVRCVDLNRLLRVESWYFFVVGLEVVVWPKALKVGRRFV